MLKNIFKKYWPFIILFSIDLILVLLHLVNFWRPISNYNEFYMEGNQSYAEHFQNIKWAVLIVLSLMIALRERDNKYYSWSILFVFLFLEDIFRIHQVATSIISQSALGGITTRQWKTLELFVASTVGLLVITPLITNYLKGSAVFRRRSKTLVALLILLVFFGIVMDQVHRLHFIWSNWKMAFIAGIVEDGGEMITASCLLGYLSYLYLRLRKI